MPFLSCIHLVKRQIVKNVKTILDIGCGKGTPLSVELAQFKGAYLIGVDTFLPSLIQAKKVYGDVILADVRFLPIRPASCDVVVASQVIEHLEKRLSFVNVMEEISNKTIIVTVPVGQNPKHELEDLNPDQAHNSEWHPEEFKKLGFQVYGCEGARFLRSEKSQFRLGKRFYPFLFLLSILTQFFTYRLVVVSYQMLCMKQVS